MPRLRIDSVEVEVPPGATVLEAARTLGIDIPTLCHLDGCAPNTSCLVCIVRVNGGKRLVPSCATPAADGMVVESETDQIRDARRTALELLLADHAGDCLAPCTNVCPAHMDIPRMIRQIEAGRLRDAIVTVKTHIALPAVLGRICPDLCESGCRRKQKDSPVSICRLKRHVADEDLASPEPYLPPKLQDSGKSVAIVGAGPTGLACAWYLLQRGHRVAIFDRHAKPGGTLRSLPDDLLPKDVLDAEISLIEKLGAAFHVSIAVGPEHPLDKLRSQYDALLLATGEMTPAKATQLGVELAGKGIKTNKPTMMTATPGVFAAGSAVTPLKHAIRACAEGRAAAAVLDRYLGGHKAQIDSHPWTVRLGVLSEPEFAALSAGSPDTLRNAAPVPHNFSAHEAREESNRCLRCDCAKLNDCRLREESVRYDASPSRFKVDRRPYERTTAHPAVTYEAGKCIACGLCVQIAERSRETLGLTFVGRGFTVRVAAPFGAELSDALKHVAKECAAACPTAALTVNASRHQSSWSCRQPFVKPDDD